MLSVVLPLRCTSESAFRLRRLESNLSFFNGFDGVECVVVDSGSSPDRLAEVRSICAVFARCRLVEDPSPTEPFAPGATRNLGAQHASGAFLLFWDVDLYACSDLVPALREWMNNVHNSREFLVVPCLYLTREGTQRVEEAPGELSLETFRDSFLRGDNRSVGHLAVSTSTVVVARSHFLRVGGNRPEYRGHGCEDFDLLHRLTSYRPTGKRPQDYYLDHKVPFVGDYRGFRAYLALRALPPLFEGIYTAHLWHPRPLTRPYHRARKANEALLQRMMRQHDAGEVPLPVLESRLEGAEELEGEELPQPWHDEGLEAAPEIGDFIARQLSRHGYDAETHPGLRRWGPDAIIKRGTVQSKLRKLVLNPRRFLADSRVPILRHLGRLIDRVSAYRT